MRVTRALNTLSERRRAYARARILRARYHLEMPYTFTRVADDNDPPTERGTYRRIDLYWAAYAARNPARRWWAELCCPGCGRVAMLAENHVVADDGTVTPSDVCPYDAAHVQRHGLAGETGCTFHEFIRLDGWSRPCTPRREP